MLDGMIGLRMEEAKEKKEGLSLFNDILNDMNFI